MEKGTRPHSDDMRDMLDMLELHQNAAPEQTETAQITEISADTHASVQETATPKVNLHISDEIGEMLARIEQAGGQIRSEIKDLVDFHPAMIRSPLLV